MPSPHALPRRRARSALAPAAYAAFGAFGVFWGAWGAALPAIRAQAGLSEGQLGTALLFVGVGALPAMSVTGRLLDRLGLRTTGVLLALLGGAGVAVGLWARDGVSAIACILVVGAASGAADVAINTLAGHAEHHDGQPVLTRAHGAFSLAVVASSLGTGALLSRALTLPVVLAVVALAVVVLAGAAGILTGPPRSVPAAGAADSTGAVRPRALGARAVVALVVLGSVGALALATENAHQSWGAVLLTDVFAASPGMAALAPAAFAGAAALARLTLAPLSRSHPVALLLLGGTVAGGGSVLLALAPGIPAALAGLAIAAAGTATLFPTLLSHSLREVAPHQRGRATSTITATAYLGFLLGPAYVGLVAGAVDLRAAILGVAAVALVFVATAAPASRWGRRTLDR
ncbi:hypothetical protein M1843_12685 [Isoptericola sp. 4D.3]|uniref:MFS transporter n=1 Tax=Isoptericola peretonis TaxID=2918523 RepID=A0ABT0J518_9MICO|nr:hypothetical protein [Isoptericola sp. 4D.3]